MNLTVCSRQRRSAAIVVIAVIAATSLVLRAQNPAEQSPAAPARNAAVTPEATGTMTIHVTVSDKNGHAIEGLQESDFSLLDNKQPQKLLGFRAVDAAVLKSDPVHVVIVVDMINTNVITVGREREEVGAYLKDNSGELLNPTSIAVIADSGVKAAPGSTQDGNKLLAAFNQTQSEMRDIGRSAGFWGDTERLQKSLQDLDQLIQYESRQPGRKLVLFVSPGWPLLMFAGDQSDMKQRDWVFRSVEHFTNSLREANIMLYCVDPFDLGRTNPFLYESYLKGISAAKDATYPALGLQVLAAHTGGQVMTNGRDIAGSLKTAIGDASEGYDLTFAPMPGDRVNEYHALEVRVDKPNIKVRTTSGYYARVEMAQQGKSR
jgi:VWFA-related protein